MKSKLIEYMIISFLFYDQGHQCSFVGGAMLCCVNQ